MGSALTRLVALFVAPAVELDPPTTASTVPPPEPAAPMRPEAFVVLVEPRDAAVAAVAVASAALARSPADAALVCHWSAVAHDDVSAAASSGGRGAAAALVRDLSAAGIAATRRHRSADVWLPTEPGAAAAALECACRAVGPVPLVLVLSGSRPAPLDDLLAGADAIVLVHREGDDRLVVELARAGLRSTGSPVVVMELPGGALASRMTASGRVTPRVRTAASVAIATAVGARSSTALGEVNDDA